MASDARPPETHELKVGEADLIYCANFSNEPAVTGGATIDSVVSVTSENAKVTIGALPAPAVNSLADFVQYDEDKATPLFTVPQGEGVKFAVTGVSKGSCKVKVKVACSDGQKPIVEVIFKVV